MIILGINPGHDASAAVLVDGRITANAAEERFTRIKHYSGLPANSLAYCLEAAGVSMADIDIIAIPTTKEIRDLNILLNLPSEQMPNNQPQQSGIHYLKRKLGILSKGPPLNLQTFPADPHTEIVYVEHHLAHAASAYYTSGTAEKQLIATLDGAGDGISCALWLGEAGQITPLLQLPVSSSLGWFYSNVTEALGWAHGHGEGKTMGLAAYGDAVRCQGVLDPYYPKFAAGDLVQEHHFGPGSIWNEYGAVQYHFEDARAIRDLIDQYGREHIAAEAQRIIEQQAGQLILPWLDRLQANRLSCAGGVFLNVKLNQCLWQSGKIKQQHIFPDAGDSGLALGAALYAHYQANPLDKFRPLPHVYHGPQFSGEQIESMLKARNLTYRFSADVAAETAEFLAQNKIVGWFQGRMEAGPRALGNRSILMSAQNPANKDIINNRVKFREPFRPFCPSLIAEAQHDYFSDARFDPFMISASEVRPHMREKISAVVHVDGTARPQMVTQAANPIYYKLLQHFGELTGEPLLLNTSFNIRGEPIACHPRDAIRCFYDNGLDVLVLGDFILTK